MKSDIAQLEKAYDLFTKGIINASQNLRNIENTADESGAKMKSRYA